jgi:outer membrane protein TolC
MRRFYILSATWFCIGLVALTGAWASPSSPLSRREAVRRAVQQHPRVEAADRRLEASQARIDQARAGFWPQFFFSERFSATTNPLWAFGTRLNQERIAQRDFDPDRLNAPRRVDNFATVLSARWSLYDSGQTRYGVRQARQDVVVAEQMGRRARHQAMAAAAAAYDGWLLALAMEKAVEQARALSGAHLEMIAERLEAGFVVKSDLLRAQVRQAELDQRRLAAASQAAIAATHLNAAMGEAPEAVFVPADTLNPGPELDRSVADWVAAALSARPEMGAMAGREAMARAETDRRRAARHPSLNLFGDYEIHSERFADSGEGYTVGAMLEWNLFAGGRDAARTREARAFLGEIHAQRRELETGIRVEIRQACLEADSAWRRIAVAAAAAAQAEENLAIVSRRYRNGLLTVVHLLDAETALEQARLQRLQAVHDYRAARVRLRLAAGSVEDLIQD